MSLLNLSRNQNGMAILLSLLILVLLVTLILDFDSETRSDLRAAGNFRDEQKAYLLAQSAVNAARAVLRDDLAHSTIDSLTEFWATPLPPFPVGDGILTGAITDEAGKFNLNQLVSNGKVDKNKYAILRRLFELLKLNPDLADPIVDWIDVDNEPMSQGAEEGYYQSLNPPYHCKNGPMDTLSELHQVKGFDDLTYNKVAPYLTVYGDGKINLNTADPMLVQALDPGIDEGLARRLVENRPWDSPQKIADLLGKPLYNNINPYLSVKSQVFSIQAEGKVGDTVKRIDAVVLRSGSDLPFLYYRVE